MATKKQKRAIALAKREKFLAEMKRQGLEALERDREETRLRKERLRKVGQDIDDKMLAVLAKHGIRE